jgi:hypothetical protein
VFIHLLPELARGDREVATKLGDELGDAAVSHVAIFLVALPGFCVVFALQWAAEQAVREGREPSPAVLSRTRIRTVEQQPVSCGSSAVR